MHKKKPRLVSVYTELVYTLKCTLGCCGGFSCSLHALGPLRAYPSAAPLTWIAIRIGSTILSHMQA